jgi:hypothetical protein
MALHAISATGTPSQPRGGYASLEEAFLEITP